MKRIGRICVMEKGIFTICMCRWISSLLFFRKRTRGMGLSKIIIFVRKEISSWTIYTPKGESHLWVFSREPFRAISLERNKTAERLSPALCAVKVWRVFALASGRLA